MQQGGHESLLYNVNSITSSLLCVFPPSLRPSLYQYHRVWSSQLILTASTCLLPVQHRDAVTTVISDRVTRGSYVVMKIYWLM